MVNIILDREEDSIGDLLASSNSLDIYAKIFSHGKTHKPIMIALYVDDSIYIFSRIINHVRVLKDILEGLSNKNLHVYDLKYFCTAYASLGISFEYANIARIHDARVNLARFYGHSSALDTPHVFIIGDKNMELKKAKLLMSKSGSEGFHPQIIPESDLIKLAVADLSNLHRSRISFETHLSSCRFEDVMIASQIAYSNIEYVGMQLDPNHIYDIGDKTVRKHFFDYSHGDTIGYPCYHFDRTNTGRLTSGFHSMKKDHRVMVTPRIGCQIVELDFTCFEPKVLFNMFGIAEPAADIYTAVMNNVPHITKREDAKQAILATIYGSSADEETSKALERRYGLMTKLAEWKEENLKDGVVSVTKYGKKLIFENNDELKRIGLNAHIQSDGAVIMLDFIARLVFAMKRRLHRCEVVATIVDAVYINAPKAEVITLAEHLIPSTIRNTPSMKSEYIQYTCKILAGKNMRDMSNVN